MSHRKSELNRFTRNNKKSNMKNQDTQKPLTVLVFTPLDHLAGYMLQVPQRAKIKAELAEYQRLVGGDVQLVRWGDYTLYVDEDGLNKGLMPSLFSPLVGTVVVSRVRNRKDVGLSEADIELLMTPFAEMLAG